MTPQEIKVIDLLASAWDEFYKMTMEHSDDATEFRHVIHQAQNIVLARPALRDLKVLPYEDEK